MVTAVAAGTVAAGAVAAGTVSAGAKGGGKRRLGLGDPLTGRGVSIGEA